MKREDLGLIARRWRGCAYENAERLRESKANYAAVVRDFAGDPTP